MDNEIELPELFNLVPSRDGNVRRSCCIDDGRTEAA